MKKLTFIISALAFSAVCFAQTTEVEKKAIEREAKIVNGLSSELEPVDRTVNKEAHQVPLKTVDQNSRLSTGVRSDNAAEMQEIKSVEATEKTAPAGASQGESQVAPTMRVKESKLQEAGVPPRQAQPKDAPTTPKK